MNHSTSNAPKRYHSALVVLHWLLAVLLLLALAAGTFVLNHTPNSSPNKIDALKGHMIVGGLIFMLTLVRLVVRKKTLHPKPASTGYVLLDRFAPYAHTMLYLLVLVMAGSGIALSILSGLPSIVFGGVGSLPVDFSQFPPRLVHGLVAKVLMAVIVLHIAAAFYHQLIRKDGLLSRMGFGPRF